MARIRTFKPEFWGDEKLSPLPPIHRLVFLGLISQADDAGRLVDNVRTLDGLLFPETKDSCADSLAILAELERIVRYRSPSGQRLIQIRNWEEHQKVKNPSPYVLPAPPKEDSPPEPTDEGDEPEPPAPPPVDNPTEPNGTGHGGESTEGRGRTGGEPKETLTPRSPIPDPRSTIPDRRSPARVREGPTRPPPSPSPPPGDASHWDRLVGYAGKLVVPHAERVAELHGNRETWAMGVMGAYGPDGTEKRLLDAVPATERAGILAAAIVRYATDAKSWDGKYFRGFVRVAAAERTQARPARPNNLGDESLRDETRRAEALRRQGQRAAEQRREDDAESDRELSELWAWWERLDAETKARINLAAQERCRSVPPGMHKAITTGVMLEFQQRAAEEWAS